jgi:hypothetical protein
MENKLPITRLSKFLSNDDFDLNIQMGQEYLHGDLNLKLVLYRVDTSKTSIDNVYGEVGKDEIKYFPPVEFNALVRIEDSKNSTYKGGLIRYNEPGNIIETAEKVRFYQVTNDGKITTDGKHNMLGYRPFYRTITCAYVQETSFRGV